MESIDRWDISPFYDGLDTQLHKDGEWVKYEDHDWEICELNDKYNDLKREYDRLANAIRDVYVST